MLKDMIKDIMHDPDYHHLVRHLDQQEQPPQLLDPHLSFPAH